ncbi:MAG: hypothetical protein NDI94_05765 [Candidatus Woesearchaeota archaeon]|nr:hypothetical protein [Candidatus Woesearchaeota archaeon]
MSGHAPMRPMGMGVHRSHIHLPGQFFLGIFFLLAGGLYVMKLFGKTYFPLPDVLLNNVCGFGSLIGGFYLLITVIWKPRVYL